MSRTSIAGEAGEGLGVYGRILRRLEERDEETRTHLARVAHYTKLIARTIGLPSDRQELLFLAAPLHDIGKITIPDHILLKAGTLARSEWEIMKTHARAGFAILRNSSSPIVRLGAEIALSHHEKFDGSGYPHRLRGEDIPLSGRICAVGDVFDALLSARPYKPSWRLADVVATLREGRGTHFDPLLVEAFLDVMPEVERVRQEFAETRAA